MLAVNPEDIQLKFEGAPVTRLDGAPAEAVIASLTALQRMILIIGMRSEGRPLGQRVKPTAKVKREYTLICRAPRPGSHIQPFNVASEAGLYTSSAAVAREKLLGALKAFDSGDEEVVNRALPNARERWFMADAASGLLPPEHSNLQVTVRAGSYGPFSFKAERARAIIQRYRAGAPPDAEAEEIVGKLRAIDYGQTILTIKPTNNRAVRVDYPLKLEPWLQTNVRRRVRMVGDPNINHVGDITGFRRIKSISELEPTLKPVEGFNSEGKFLKAVKPLSIPITFDYEDRLFTFQDEGLGIDAYSEEYAALRENVLEELDVLWRNYAIAPDVELAADALAVKSALTARFKGDK